MSELQSRGPLQINYVKEDVTNGANGSRPHNGHRSNRDDMIRDGRFLDTSDRRVNGHKYYSSFGNEKYRVIIIIIYTG